MGEPANGSTPTHQTSWWTVNEAARLLSVPTDVLRPILASQGLDVGPEDRRPVEVFIAAVERAGYVPEPLVPVGPPSVTSRLLR